MQQEAKRRQAKHQIANERTSSEWAAASFSNTAEGGLLMSAQHLLH